MYSALHKFIEMANVSEESIARLREHLHTIHLSKDALLIRKGQLCNHFYIIEKGFARLYWEVNDKQVTTFFAKENDLITSSSALFTRQGSKENIQVLEDSVLLKLHYDEFIHLCTDHPDLLRLYRAIMEKYFLSMEERALSLQIDSAFERYHKLLSRHPFILQRASLGSIASFLGMSPVTLSRMRSQVS